MRKVHLIQDLTSLLRSVVVLIYLSIDCIFGLGLSHSELTESKWKRQSREAWNESERERERGKKKEKMENDKKPG